MQKSHLRERGAGSESTHVLPAFNEEVAVRGESHYYLSLVNTHFQDVIKQKNYPSIPQLVPHEFFTIQ